MNQLKINSGREQQTESQLIKEISKSGETVNKYQKGKFLGKGGFAKVYEFTEQKNFTTYAGKVIPKSQLAKQRQKQKLLSEIKIHKNIKHTNIVKFQHVFEDNDNVYILLEVCRNQTLNELLKRRKKLTDLETQQFISQIIRGVQHMHQNLIIHRDLKLGNLFLDEKLEIKIGDLGLAAQLSTPNEKKKTICGTPNYIAPEILESKGHSFEVDVWSIGVILYTMLIGKPPFETQEVKTTYRKIKNNDYKFPEHVIVNPLAQRLIQSILQTDPSKRPTLQQIMNSPYMKPYDIQIPKLLPLSIMDAPPSQQFVQSCRKYSLEIKPSNSKLNININSNHSRQNSNCFQTDEQQTNRIGRHQKTQSMSNNNYQIQNNVQQNYMNNNINTISNQNNSSSKQMNSYKGIDTWVTKWIDYSSKYGLGYILNNGNTGVYFNDSTKILELQDEFVYVQRNQQKQEVVKKYTNQDYPQEINKKYTLLQHFKNHLLDAESKSRSSSCQQIYVKKWMKTKQAIMFRLSNKVIQVIFKDLTEILLSSEWKFVCYVNKKKERMNYPLNNALESENTEMSKRLKYTKDILSQMLGQQNKVNDENFFQHYEQQMKPMSAKHVEENNQCGLRSWGKRERNRVQSNHSPLKQTDLNRNHI